MPEKNRRLGLSKSRYILLWYKTFSQYLNFFWVTNVCFFNLQVKVKLLEVKILKNRLEHFSNNLKDTDLELELKQDFKRLNVVPCLFRWMPACVCRQYSDPARPGTNGLYSRMNISVCVDQECGSGSAFIFPSGSGSAFTTRIRI